MVEKPLSVLPAEEGINLIDKNVLKYTEIRK
jgi:hypothetical protein